MNNVSRNLAEIAVEAVHREISRFNKFPQREYVIDDGMRELIPAKLGFAADQQKSYIDLAREGGVDITPEVIARIGGQSADIIFNTDDGPQIVENKLYDEDWNPRAVKKDYDKIVAVNSYTRVGGYICLVVTDTHETCSWRIEKVQACLGQDFDYVTEQHDSPDHVWKWCVAALKVAVN